MKRMVGLTGALVLALAWAGAASAQVKRATVTAAANFSAVEPGQAAAVAVTVDIAKGFHAQSNTPKDEFLVPLTVSVEKDAGVKAGDIVYPPGVDETYPGLGTVNVYSGKVTVFVPVTIPADAKAGAALKVAGKVRYQICDDSTCFQPESTPWSVEVAVVEKGKAVGANGELFKDFKVATTQATTQPGGRSGAGGGSASAGAPPVVMDEGGNSRGVLGWLGIAFVAGILFNVVPCVLPMLPIKVLGFAEVAAHDRGKTVLLASVFGLGVVSVFAVLAVFILVLKKITWGEQFSNPYFAWGMVVVMLGLSLWLFGVLNVNLPAAAYGFAPRHDTYVGNYQWGVLTAVFSTPCTGPLFPPVMLWAQSQPTAAGVSIMMMVGVGMAFPYVVLSAFPEAARRFPRVGPWSELFKQMLGFMLLGFTVFFAAGQLTTPAGQWWAAVPVAGMAALYLMARTVQLSKEARAVGIAAGLAVVIVTASVLVACRFSGVFDARPGGGGQAAVDWLAYSDETIEAARKANKLVLVKFTANWCLNCQYIEATVFHDAGAAAALRKHDVVTVKADLTKEDAPGWGRLRGLSATGGIPLTAIYVPGYEKPVVLTSVYTTGTLVSTLDQVGGKAVAAAKP